MRRFRRLAARAERRGWHKTLGSLSFRPRHAIKALLPPRADARIVRGLTHKGYLRQGLERLLLLLAYRLEPNAYYGVGLFEPIRFRRAGEFVSHRQLVNLFQYLDRHPSTELIGNKARFAQHCACYGIPAPTTLGVWDPPNERVPAFFDRLRLMARDEGVFCKLVDGYGGAGACSLRLNADKTWSFGRTDAFEDAVSWDCIRRTLAEEGRPLLVQQRVRNHPSIAIFGETPTMAVRLITLRDGEEIRPLMAMWRLGRSGAVVDNASQGGLMVGVDLRTGTLGKGTWTESGVSVPNRIEHAGARHIELAGRRLPLWEEVLEIGMRVHQSVGDILSLGHDIAISTDGPVVLETNTGWAARVQISNDRGLGATDFPRVALAAAAAPAPGDAQ